MDDSKLIILSAGGTGGHIMPAQALGQDLLSRGYRVEVIMDSRGQKFAPLFKNMPIHIIKSGTMGPGIFGKLSGGGNLGLGILKAFKLLGALKPAVVVGFGGYPSFPAVYAAQRLHIPTILHEQNAIIGKANAMLAHKAERIAISLPQVSGLDAADYIRTVVTGNPVRPEIAELYNRPYPILDNAGTMRILVMGGSLGAQVFSDVVPQTLARLSAEYRARLHVVQQCRENDLEKARKAYEDASIKAELSTFLEDVPAQLEAAHLVISRSGASTVAEVATAGRPAIFVPYPHHQDQQQKMNANAIADVGGAWVMTQEGFTVEALLARMETFLQNPETLFRAAENARSCGRPDAARKLGNLVTALASGWDKK